MSAVRESFAPHLIEANGSYQVRGAYIGGFLAKTSGTISITDTSTGTLFVDAVPVTAGIYTPLPFNVTSIAGMLVQLAGGASGTLAV